MAVPDHRARKSDDRRFDAPSLPQPLPREHLEPQEPEDARAEPQRRAVQPPAQRRRKHLMLVLALLLVLIEVVWIVAISVFTYWAVT